MGQPSRRTFITSAGAGAAAGVVAMASPSPASAAARHHNAAEETVVAYVEDHHGSSVRLLVGEREVVVHDRDLVVRLLNAAGGK